MTSPSAPRTHTPPFTTLHTEQECILCDFCRYQESRLPELYYDTITNTGGRAEVLMLLFLLLSSSSYRLFHLGPTIVFVLESDIDYQAHIKQELVPERQSTSLERKSKIQTVIKQRTNCDSCV